MALVYLKLTNAKGVRYQWNLVWDRVKFLESMMKQYSEMKDPLDNCIVEVTTDEDYFKSRKKPVA